MGAGNVFHRQKNDCPEIQSVFAAPDIILNAHKIITSFGHTSERNACKTWDIARDEELVIRPA